MRENDEVSIILANMYLRKCEKFVKKENIFIKRQKYR